MHPSPEPTSASTARLNSPLAGYSVFGPRSGYSPQISILVSQLDWMRQSVLMRLHDLTRADLDWLPSPDGNTVGALLLHLAASETYYQFHTFDGLPWATTSPETKKRFGPAMRLGDLGRRLVRNHDLPFYLDTLAEVRERTLNELRKRDDVWLMSVDKNWFWGPTNNLCKWFHICEHESHHLGQIDLHLKSIRLRR
ncbi:MAG: DinB family protein [Acidobacteriaceae bacterium]